MREIPLTQGKVAIVDDEDYEYLMQWKWHLSCNGYARRSVDFYKQNGKRSGYSVFMHRQLISAPIQFKVDHINNNRLDNRRLNIRLCTDRQNSYNSKARKNNKSGFKGVCKEGSCFRADISINGKKIYLGRFKCKIEAARVWNEAALKYHGEFAKLNEI